MVRLKILTVLVDYCDTFTSIYNHKDHIYDSLSISVEIQAREKHSHGVRQEFLNHRKNQENVVSHTGSGTGHVLSDFAENVLLPKLLGPPGHIGIIAGLQFHLVVFESSTLGTDVFLRVLVWD